MVWKTIVSTSWFSETMNSTSGNADSLSREREIIPADLPDTGHTRAHRKIKYSAEFHRSSPSLPYTPRYPCPFKPWNDVTTFTSSTSTFLIASIGSKTRASNLTISLEQKCVHNFLSLSSCHSSLYKNQINCRTRIANRWFLYCQLQQTSYLYVLRAFFFTISLPFYFPPFINWYYFSNF